MRRFPSSLLRGLPQLSLTALLMSCGQGTDPFEALGDPKSTPAFISPVDSAGVYRFPFSGGSPQLGLDLVANGTAFRIKAPFGGLITSLEGGATSINVTAFTNAHYTWVVTNLSSVDLRVGDVVKIGQEIGNGNNLMSFKVLLDGTPVCPYPFMDASGKAFVNSGPVATPCI